MKGFIGGIPIALLAVAAQAKFVERVCPIPNLYRHFNSSIV
jgi:hypothetical protein